MIKIFKSHIVTSILVYGSAAILLASAIWLAYQYVDPAPPKKVVIAAGNKSGAYYKYAKQYAAFFKKQGIELEILETNGSMDNLQRMSEDDGVDAAFMQGGITTPEQHPDLNSLGSLYYEPLWVFYDHTLTIERIPDLIGMKVAIGPEGSGTNHMIKGLLTENGIFKENTTILDHGYSEALPELINGNIDVMFMISGVKSRAILDMSQPNSKLKLLSFTRAEAYARSHHFLTRLILPQGSINLANNLPTHDVNLLAPTANLVVSDDMHPAIKYLFLIAASKIHGGGDLFSLPGQFPNEKSLLLPLSDEAKAFYKKGPPLLMRYLPYRLAITLERLKILLIPLLTLLYPLFKITPPAYRWQIRRRIFKWYKDLKELDIAAYDTTSSQEAETMLQQLEQLDRQVMETSVPLSYTDHIYSLRIHIRMIQDRLKTVVSENQTNTEG
ncbi:MAG: TAXI family TRAP transporter solute-binding subunit [Pseudodesulfovibrio sp.]|nr:TAXI family TRAP transporter solute-binding subunit [Pseudodesulfovibrio sp.]